MKDLVEEFTLINLTITSLERLKTAFLNLSDKTDEVTKQFNRVKEYVDELETKIQERRIDDGQ